MTFKNLAKKFIPKFLLRAYHFCWALLGAIIFGCPGYNKNAKIIGVTGTSGKSTTCDMIVRILEETGNKVAAQSSIRFKISDKEWDNKYKMTMPGRFVIQKFLWQAKKAKCNFVVLEVTSEGIRQFRHKFINFDCAVFTNLSPEHIESHGGFENYRNEKLKLFRATKNIHIINVDDINAKYFLNIPAKEKIEFSVKNVSNFNVMNGLAATAVAKAYGIGAEVCKKVLEKVNNIPGRMEIVAEYPVKVIVDYAHTPEQLEAVYKSLNSNLICVLGSCGGGRDKWKRPVLGEIASKYCKEIIITNEDPYDENPMEIINKVAEKAGSNAQKILDRKEAIQKAVSIAKSGDCIIITGKGSEPWMCVENGKKIPWSDRNIVKEIINKK
jgi:UDP-N-acetylmuramoyl-L-alanyl-D-glutamate--2,6-diaminopimelate ligase